MNEYSHIHPKFQHVMALSPKERIQFLDMPRWIGYGAANNLIKVLAELMEKPKKPRMPNLLIYGDSNNGKTTIIRHFVDQYGQCVVDEHGETHKPAVLVECPSTPDEKALYKAILVEMMAPYRSSHTAAELADQVVDVFRSCHVKMLVIDELHNLLAGTPIKQRQTMNGLKRLCNRLMIPIVAAGTNEAVLVLHKDEQHASRFDTFELPTWNKDQDFTKLVASLETTLPLKERSNLTQPEILSDLHIICSGNFGDLHRLLTACARDAIESGKERIDAAIIKSNNWVRPTQGLRKRVA